MYLTATVGLHSFIHVFATNNLLVLMESQFNYLSPVCGFYSR